MRWEELSIPEIETLDREHAVLLSPPGGMGHACEFETATMQHLHPDLVAIEKAQVTYPDTGSAYLSTDLLAGARLQ